MNEPLRVRNMNFSFTSAGESRHFEKFLILELKGVEKSRRKSFLIAGTTTFIRRLYRCRTERGKFL